MATSPAQGPNTFGLILTDNAAGAGAATVNATGGSITVVGNTIIGLGVFTNDAGGINVTTSGGHSIDLVNTASGSTNRGMFITNSGTSGDIVIVSGSHIFASGGASSQGFILGMDNPAGRGQHQRHLERGDRPQRDDPDRQQRHFPYASGTSGNIAATINANIIAGTGASAGIQATFSNAGNNGTAGFTIANGVTISGSS